MRASSSTRRSCTRSCSTRRSRGACADGSRHGDRPQLDAMQLGWHALLPPLRDRRRVAVRRRGRPTSSACRRSARRRSASTRSPTRRPRSTRSSPRSTRPRSRARSGSRTLDAAGVPVRGLDARLRARPLRRSRDDREGLGRRSTGTRIVGEDGRSSGCSSTCRRHRASSRAHRSCRARTHAPILRELGYDDDRIDEARRSRRPSSTLASRSAEPMPCSDPPVAHASTTSASGTASPTGSCSSSAAPRAARCATHRRRCAASATRSSGTRRSPCGHGHRLHVDRVAPPHRARRRRRASSSLVELDEGVRFVSNLARRRRRPTWRNDMAVDGSSIRGRSTACVLPQFRPVGRRGEGVMRDYSDETAIVGIGQTEFSKNSGAASCSSRARRSRAAVADAGLTPADIDGMVTFAVDSNDELALIRCARHPRAALHRPHAAAVAAARARPCSSRPPRSRRARPTRCVVYRAFNERSGRRFGQPHRRRTTRRA